ncbi:hypothetical protein SAMN06265339_1170 [Desulfurobacterium pacificum]|jgi:flagellar motility protein MotE (MotC chaperone)|uniref:Magnesium transporter MgtE intracellular domain-containing protein n=1 Tax=Desulfurobacterium pacificum TaxID=240166 RepID=A0ABY1NPC4_9BACT|nr:hypothetical protein [Desulfurobacterium pacificum]SMP13824.1 hypothetical protein SAMN06265339_1170 [Desulfurobacterium pacificum]
MKYSVIIIVLLCSIFTPYKTQAQEAQKAEIQREMQKLIKLRSELQKLIQKKEELLKQIKQERAKLKAEKEALEKELKEAEAERYKKLAQIFEKMDPELAGQKISKMTNPKEAALIIYNMKTRLAGQVMNYVDPEMANKIVQILTQIKIPSSNSTANSQ